MSTELPVLAGVLRRQRRTLPLWGLALAAVCGMYIGFYPFIGGMELQSLVDALPEELAVALGYDRIGSASGYLTSTVYGLLAPILLGVFAITSGARLIAGEEEDGTLELELTAPVSRRRVFLERLAALWLSIAALVAVVAIVTVALANTVEMDVGVVEILAGASGLLLLVLGFGTLALAAGAVAGRRTVALGIAAGVAVLAFVLDAIGPTVDAGWMTAVSPFSWYLGGDPLLNGFDWRGLALLALVPVIAAAVGLARFSQRDLMV